MRRETSHANADRWRIACLGALPWTAVEAEANAGERAEAWNTCQTLARRSDILDEESMQSYYEEFGFPSYYDGNHTSYETEAAITLQRRVLIETGKEPSAY